MSLGIAASTTMINAGCPLCQGGGLGHESGQCPLCGATGPAGSLGPDAESSVLASSLPAQDNGRSGQDHAPQANPARTTALEAVALEASLSGSEHVQKTAADDYGQSSGSEDDQDETGPARAAMGLVKENMDNRGDAVTSDQRLQELKARDREVRAHEQAHIAAGGRHVAGGARYEYERGPDNNYYAVSGEVEIDTTPEPGNPEATIEKARTVRQAAQAPAQPSAQDQAVAAKAAQMEAEAKADRQEEEKKEKEENGATLGGDPPVTPEV